ncbi:LAO/AO transport system ATPase [Deferribacter desulfuricans SSM1]|uniref:LAO/AO transport system ATPase n=1 Tax=Deferribacter desulfuricans (strain DSM 14783 / JCM 11476 / NBRC 101012 / SSM1) TaxID=639282 RepID=D3P9Y4_DEFDS|nr:methylmalonyl Co-A mutase-associated GTPase MeaB [Deferribacter desulfuricans]BAI81524.1 LAO/AO transport system ATPase [Deferribacter desulfuricans SSM1]
MLYEKVLEGDRRALARLIRFVDDRVSGYEEEVSRLLDKCGNAHFIGITGSPGAGKSTLTNEIIKHYRKLDKKVAVVAIDPTSPFSHGAILGDRIRMLDHANDENVFIRSVATRGHLGGLSSSAVEIAMVFDAAGYDIVIIETVGVGQDEVDIAYVADTCLVVSVPGLGDDIQAIKAGILEIGDIFVVNKADKDEAIRTVRDLELMIELSLKEGWKPPVVKTVATKGEGVSELIGFIQKHRESVPSKHFDRLYYIGKQYLLEHIEKKLLTYDKFLEYLQNIKDPYKIVKKNILNTIEIGGNNGS